jgi:hypothetical protein
MKTMPVCVPEGGAGSNHEPAHWLTFQGIDCNIWPGIALFFRIVAAFSLSKNSTSVMFYRDVASSIGTVKGQDKRSAPLRALDTTNASGCRVGIR